MKVHSFSRPGSIYDSATGRIYYDADGSGARAQVLFAQVTAGLAITSAHFLVGA